MPLDPRIDRQRFHNLWRSMKAAQHEPHLAPMARAAGRSLIKELVRAGVWEEWSGEDNGIVEQELHYPLDMLVSDDKLRTHVVTGDEHFSTIARLTLDRAKPSQFNDTERKFMSEVQCYRTASEKQMDWISSLAKRIGIDWGPPDEERSGPLGVRPASRK
jgi:hypothetical protein